MLSWATRALLNFVSTGFGLSDVSVAFGSEVNTAFRVAAPGLTVATCSAARSLIRDFGAGTNDGSSSTTGFGCTEAVAGCVEFVDGIEAGGDCCATVVVVGGAVVFVATVVFGTAAIVFAAVVFAAMVFAAVVLVGAVVLVTGVAR